MGEAGGDPSSGRGTEEGRKNKGTARLLARPREICS